MSLFKKIDKLIFEKFICTISILCTCWLWSEVSVAQSCRTLCDPMDCSLLDFSVPGIFQARILEWVATSFSRRSSQPRGQTWVSCIAGRFFTTSANWEYHLYLIDYIRSWRIFLDDLLHSVRQTLLLLLLSRFSCVWLFATPRTAAFQVPLPVGFSR